MNKLVLLISVIALSSFSFFQQKKKVVFFGDSITQAGVGPEGYITVLGDLLKQRGQDANFELIGAGISGNKVYDLYLRMEDDVLKRDPGIVVIWIGVNDVWHKASSGTGTDANKFEQFYKAIIRKLKAQGAQVVLCTPSTIGEKTDFTNQQDGDLNRYSVIIRNLAAEHDCTLVDFRSLFREYNLQHNGENKPSGILTTDGVHLNAAGNRFVAEKFLSVLLPGGRALLKRG